MMMYRFTLPVLLFVIVCPVFAQDADQALQYIPPSRPRTEQEAKVLELGFVNPPNESRLSCFWWWLNGHVTKEAITKDITEMKDKGFGSAMIFDGDGSSQGGNIAVTPGPTFASPEWTELFVHAVREAARNDFELALMIQSGWNLGGPNITPEWAAKRLVCNTTYFNSNTNSAGNGIIKLPLPPAKLGYYKDIAVLAFPTKSGAEAKKRVPLKLFNIKIATHEFGGSAPDCRPLLEGEAPQPGDPDLNIKDVVDWTDKMQPDGTLDLSSIAETPKTDWTILRFGYTPTGARVSTSSGKWQGLVLDHLRTEAFDFYWDSTVKPLLESVKPHCGKTLKYIETDSWEAGGLNWTEDFRSEFQKRRGYDPLPYLPIVAGYIADSRNLSNRFLNDFRRTIGDLIADNHYRRMKLRAAEYNLGILPESGGPHGAPIDSLQLLGISDIPMSEFWSWSPKHRVGDANRFFTKQPASAAHTNGHKFVAAEGETNIGMYWQESFAENLKPAFDQAVCEGMNRLVWHTVPCSPVEAGLPGNVYFAGTYFNPQTIVWQKSKPFLQYINRVQFLLQQGLPTADVLQYYGEGVPNFTQGKGANTAESLPGYDYDVASEDVLLHQIADVKDGRMILKDGVNYRVLVLPERKTISKKALEKIKELIESGATIIGTKPESLTGLPAEKFSAAEVDSWWNPAVQSGRIISGKTAHQYLREQGVKPDFEILSEKSEKTRIEWIHRTVYVNQLLPPKSDKTVPVEWGTPVAAEIYYVANLTKEAGSVNAAFRVVDRLPELWNPVTGEIQDAKEFVQKRDKGQTDVRLDFPAFGSMFVVFRKPTMPGAYAVIGAGKIIPNEQPQLTGTWQVQFRSPFVEEKPFEVTMDKLESWSKSENSAVKYFSGTATYRNGFELFQPASGWRASVAMDFPQESKQRVYLQFGKVCEFADVKVNGKPVGAIWAPPYRLDITEAVKTRGVNQLEIEVVNRWVNRLVGDAMDGSAERLTKTNCTHITKATPLMESGIIGPVRIIVE